MSPLIMLVIPLLIVIFWVGRKHLRYLISGLLWDLLDFALSTIDEPLDLLMDTFAPETLGIASFIPWEPGDFFVAARIFHRERHVMGKFFATIAALEAVSFFIEPVLEMLPAGSLIATPVGWFFNVFPMMTILRLITRYKVRAAEKGFHEIKGLKEVEEKIGVKVDKDLKTDEKGLRKLRRKGFWEDMIQWLKHTHSERKKAWKKIRQDVNGHIAVAADVLATVGKEWQAWQQQLAFASEQLDPATLQGFAQMNNQILDLLEQSRQLIELADKQFPAKTLLGKPDPHQGLIAESSSDKAIQAAAAAEEIMREASQALANTLMQLATQAEETAGTPRQEEE